MQLPQSIEKWIREADLFQTQRQFPHCLGAIDGKHVLIQKPAHSGSTYFNYKGSFSVVLMAVVNAKYKFLSVDVGANGRISDDGVFRNSSFGRLLHGQHLNIPPSAELQGSNIIAPYVFVGDEAFQLTDNLMKPYNAASLTPQKRQFNYKVSRARSVVECAFGQLSARFQIFRQPIRVSPQKANQIVLAACYLHNFLQLHCQSAPHNDTNTVQQEPLTNLEPSSTSSSRFANKCVVFLKFLRCFIHTNLLP